MEKIPRPVLTEILFQVGSIEQVIILSLVCKKWKEIIANYNHEISFQNIRYEKAQPWKTRSYITKLLTYKFLKEKWKLVSLDLKSVNVNVRILANLIISQPHLRKLDLLNSQIDFDKLSHLLIIKKSLQFKHNKYEIVPQLEELKCSYLKPSLFNFLDLLPKLKKLNIEHQYISFGLFIHIIKHFNNLEFLEVSFSEEINDSRLEAINNALQYSNLKSWLINIPREWICLLPNTELSVYNYDEWLKEDFDLEEIQKWLKREGDINLCYKFIYNLIEKNDDEFLIEAFQMFIKCGLDKWYHDCSFHCNYVAYAALKGKLKLFWYLIDMGFHLFECRNFNILISCPEIINELLIQENLKIKILDEKIYEAAQFFMIKKEQKYLMPLIHLMALRNIGRDEENMIRKKFGRQFPRKNLFGLPNYIAEICKLFYTVDIEPLISIAAIYEMKDIIAALIHSGFNINARDLKGNTALCYIAQKGNIGILRYLIENGADINNEIRIIDKNMSKSPIKMAIESGRGDFVTELINSGANLSIIDKSGLTALEYARKLGKLDIEDILKRALEI